MVGKADDQDVLIGAGVEAIDVDAIGFRQRNRRLPACAIAPVSYQHGTRSVAQSVGVDHQVITHDVN